MGFQHIDGLSEAQILPIIHARKTHHFHTLDEFLRRVSLPEATAIRLANAGAFDGLGSSRREVIWAIRHAKRQEPLPLFPNEDPRNDAPRNGFSPLSLQEMLHWDHDSMHLSTRGHLLAPLRRTLREQGLLSARDTAHKPNGSYVRHAGLIIVRQRPATASGVVFLTMEDETGLINVVIWARIWAQYAAMIRSRPLLIVEGRVQRQGNVTHIIADRFRVPREPHALPAHQSHDFH